MTTPDLPLTGYTIEKIYVNHLAMHHKKPGEPDSHGQVTFGWDWRLLPSEDLPLFEVRIRFGIEPAPDRDDFCVVGLVGRFKQRVETPVVDLPGFVKLQAPAILLPFARQVIAAATGAGFFGPFYLPPITVPDLMKDFDFSTSTGGKQLAQHSMAEAEATKAATKKQARKTASTKRKKKSA